MSILLVAMVGIPIAWHISVIAVVYYDTGRMPLDRRRWLLLTAAIPIFGFFMYLFERSELSYDPESDPYRGNNYNIHPSRADDAPLPSQGDDRPPTPEELDDGEWPPEDEEVDRRE